VIVQVRDDGGQQVFKVMLTFTTERPGDAKNCTGGPVGAVAMTDTSRSTASR
jgi:hypothetical protein